MVDSIIPHSIKAPKRFFIIACKARSVASTISIADTNLDIFLIEQKRNLLYDHNIQQRRAHRWNSTTFESFRCSQSILKATSAYIEFSIAHQKGLPMFIKRDQCILKFESSIQKWAMLSNAIWTVYSNHLSDRIVEILKTAASNHDMR